LLFGIEEQISYCGHKQIPVQEFTQNLNNKLNVTWDTKYVHLWNMGNGKKKAILKMIDLTKTHCQISAVAFSHKYRVSKTTPAILLLFCSLPIALLDSE